MLLLLALSHAAEPAGVLLRLKPSVGIGAGPAGGAYTLENLGAGESPRLTVVASGVTLTSPATLVVAPGQKQDVRLRYDGGCPEESYGGCGNGLLSITAPGGSFSVQVTVYPPNLDVLGSMPERTWWNGAGPLAPSAPGRAWEAPGLGLGGSWAGLGPKYGPVTNVALTAAKGPIALVLSVQDTVPSTVSPTVHTRVQDVLLQCDAARTKAHSEYGEDAGFSMAWGADGIVSAIAYNGGSWDEGFEPCVARALVGQDLATTTPGTARASWTTPRTK